MAKKTTQTEAKRATLNSEQYNVLVRYVQGVELKRMEYQQALNVLVAKRDAYYSSIAAQYHLPIVFSKMSWDDDTLQIAVE